MSLGLVYAIVFGILGVVSVVLAIIITKALNNDKNIELLGAQLENSDASISDAMSYLKITNEWNR